VRFLLPAAVLLASIVLTGAASATARVDGGLRIDLPGRPVAGQPFRLDLIVDSLPLGTGQPFDFTLVLVVPDGLEVLGWGSITRPPSCTQRDRAVSCTSRVLGGDIHSADIRFTLRAARLGTYTVDAIVDVAGTDTNRDNNRAQSEITVAAAPSAPTTRRGTAGNDVLRGTGGNDRLFGLGGADTLRGLAGNDLLDGGAGNDRLFGDAGLDTYVGGAGNDTISAADGRAETVSCGAGRDSVRADRRDRLRGCEVVRR
jgi:hypothetical protein